MDQAAEELFRNQISSDKNLNIHFVKRFIQNYKLTDAENLEIFLNSINKNNRVIKLDDKKRQINDESSLVQQLVEQVEIEKRAELQNSVSGDENGGKIKRLKRDINEQAKQLIQPAANNNNVNPKEEKKSDTKPNNENKAEDLHSYESDESTSHSAIGVTLVLGFVFMLLVDQIGGKFSHRPHQSRFLLIFILNEIIILMLENNLCTIFFF